MKLNFLKDGVLQDSSQINEAIWLEIGECLPSDHKADEMEFDHCESCGRTINDWPASIPDFTSDPASSGWLVDVMTSSDYQYTLLCIDGLCHAMFFDNLLSVWIGTSGSMAEAVAAAFWAARVEKGEVYAER